MPRLPDIWIFRLIASSVCGGDFSITWGRKPLPRNRTFRIAYVGNVYLGRDPRPFLSALASVRRTLQLTPAQVRVDFAGNCTSFRGVQLQSLVDELGLSEYVHFHGWMSRDKALKLQEESDLLLLLAQDQPIQIPNKLFEYLGMGKPILAFADESGETTRILRSVGGHHVVTGNSAAQAESAMLTALDHNGAERGDYDAAVLQELLAEHQMARLIRHLRAV